MTGFYEQKPWWSWWFQNNLVPAQQRTVLGIWTWIGGFADTKKIPDIILRPIWNCNSTHQCPLPSAMTLMQIRIADTMHVLTFETCVCFDFGKIASMKMTTKFLWCFPIMTLYPWWNVYLLWHWKLVPGLRQSFHLILQGPNQGQGETLNLPR